MSTIQAVFFDLGGTLFSYRGFARSSTDFVRSMAERLGLSQDEARDPRVGAAYGQVSAEVFRDYNRERFYLHRDLFCETFRRFALSLERTPDEDFVEASYLEMRGWMIESFTLRDDCLSTLDRLRAQGLYLSIVSNIDDDMLHPVVERGGLAPRLDHWTSSEEARSCKPDPRFFELALEKAGCGPEQVLFVGDSPTHDIAGARPLGMQTALIVEQDFDPPGQSADGEASHSTPDHHIRALAELCEIVGARD